MITREGNTECALQTHLNMRQGQLQEKETQHLEQNNFILTHTHQKKKINSL